MAPVPPQKPHNRQGFDNLFALNGFRLSGEVNLFKKRKRVLARGVRSVVPSLLFQRTLTLATMQPFASSTFPPVRL